MLKLRLVQELRSSGYIVIKALLDNRHRCRVNRVRSYLPCVYMPYPYLKDKCEVLTTACEKLMDLLSSSPSGSLMSVEEDIMIDEGHPHYLLWLERANKNGVWAKRLEHDLLVKWKGLHERTCRYIVHSWPS